MEIKAIGQIIEWDAEAGRSVIIAAGASDTVSDSLGQRLVDEVKAEIVPADPLDHDRDGEPGGSLPASPPSLFGKSKAALIEIASAENVAVTGEMTAKDIMAAINAKRDGEPGGDDTGAPIA